MSELCPKTEGGSDRGTALPNWVTMNLKISKSHEEEKGTNIETRWVRVEERDNCGKEEAEVIINRRIIEI